MAYTLVFDPPVPDHRFGRRNAKLCMSRFALFWMVADVMGMMEATSCSVCMLTDESHHKGELPVMVSGEELADVRCQPSARYDGKV
ncbi:hypothetical protein Pmar_PMAR016078 [Perkinsus marinus ATCC 50983]|uniref:Uncharacterized protein n=1 Tax=Perkinsus marinus (strain ATCC 50983 / TXsc) TaxID=423536 RepID=C5LYZ3_PERM5|nr:hypothetical protein Pmar_PMAR016078 [Perkinsus marinus ATCC 50983]EEQ98002.1 hypothetical protein Pmar_PMAR016078 [Perkinsus marinus ATCC 50983]|eukprot:XP_002765285.1 hypothetical protein Pmar_PMAR016078 [Perkinsus marinus ATCC 50983]